MEEARLSTLRIVITGSALVVAGLHMLFPRFIPDIISAGLLLIALIPWISPIIKSIEITGVGKVELQEVKQKQAVLQGEVNALRFLVSGFVTDWEYTHLQKLASPDPFEYGRGPNKDDRFIGELVRLRDHGLVAKRMPWSLWDIPLQGNLKDYVELTERGRTYIELRKQTPP